jgi:nitroreductase
MKKRKTVRKFSNEKIDKNVIINCIKAAGTAPSGANQQPWTFVLISDQKIKRKIRIAAEKEEKEFYSNRASEEWLEALKPLGTNESKPFLEEAPYLIVIFEKKYSCDKSGDIIKHYYTKESVGIASGILITALHNCGLVTLTHTPSPMQFLNKILKRPSNEKAFLILVTGYPAQNVMIPKIKKKNIEEILISI